MATKPKGTTPEPTSQSYRIETPDEIALDRARHARAGVNVGTLPYPDRAAVALTERQADGFACVLCGRESSHTGPTVPVGTCQGVQLFACVSCTEPGPAAMAEIDEDILRVAELVGMLYARNHGARAGTLAYGAVRDVLTDVARGRDVDVERTRELLASLRRDDSAGVEQELGQ